MAAFLIRCSILFAHLYIPSFSWLFHTTARRPAILRPATVLRVSEIVDAEFERTDNVKADVEKQDPVVRGMKDFDETSLFDMSLDSDPEMQSLAVPFSFGDDYIDAKLAFTVDMDGVSYGIGVPFEHAAAVTVENRKDGTVSYLAPDDDDNEELLEIMAAQLQGSVGPDLKLKRTPRVLTISGPLNNYTSNWKSDLVPKPVDAAKLLEVDDDEDLDFFHKFMKDELGEEEYLRTLEEDNDDLSDELLSLFDIPGLGNKKDDVEGMAELIDSITDSPEEEMKVLEGLGESLHHDGVALKLVSYILPDGKSYSLVRLLKPYALVARQISNGDETRFELLSREEERLVIPQLEEVCKDDLKRIGLELE